MSASLISLLLTVIFFFFLSFCLSPSCFCSFPRFHLKERLNEGAFIRMFLPVAACECQECFFLCFLILACWMLGVMILFHSMAYTLKGFRHLKTTRLFVTSPLLVEKNALMRCALRQRFWHWVWAFRWQALFSYVVFVNVFMVNQKGKKTNNLMLV